MKNSGLTVALTNTSIAHSPQRIRVGLSGKRFLSLPNYSFNLLKHPAIKADYKILAEKAKKMSNILTKGNSVHIITSNGTDLNLEITNRNSNYAPGFVNNDILLGSPPDIETNIAPLETKTNGRDCCRWFNPARKNWKIRISHNINNKKWKNCKV